MNKKILNFHVVSNITLEPYFKRLLIDKFSKDEVVIRLTYKSFDDMGHTNEDVDAVIVWPNLESIVREAVVFDGDALTEYVQTRLELLSNDIKLYYKNNALWVGLEDYFDVFTNCIGRIQSDYGIADKINLWICKNVYKVIDLKRIIASISIKKSYNSVLKYRWNSIYSQCLISNIVDEIYIDYQILRGYTKKCLVIDCDNVLWEGILSEDGIENINVGPSGIGLKHYELQKMFKKLGEMGVLLTICSKNNLNDVLDVFERHPGMVLKSDDIVSFKVNWENKASNIVEISKTLNISLDSIVLIDDSIFEIESVKYLLPDVETFHYLPNCEYEFLNHFKLNVLINKSVVRKRVETYQSNILRDNLLNQCVNFDDYLDALNTCLTIEPAKMIDLRRLSELTQRTNKCTNGTRYTYDELLSRYNNVNYLLYAVSVSDKFSDLGIVGVFGIAVTEQSNYLDLFALSCRSLGRKVEEYMIDYIKDKYSVVNYRFLETSKNENLSILLTKSLM